LVSDQVPAKQLDLRRLQSTVPIITGVIGNQARIGTWGAVTGITTPTAGTVFTVNHPLGRIPNGWILYYTALGSVLYAPSTGTTSWTTTTISLRSTVTGDTVSILVI
jgi:hypothetical protein